MCAGHAPHPGSHRNALLTYVHTWRSFASLHPGVDFMLSTFESWRRSSGHYPNKKIDLVAVASERVAEKLQQHVTVGHICQVQKLSIMSSVESWHAVGDHTIRDHPYSQCWILTHNSTHGQEWQGFPLVHDILHLGSDDFRHFMEEMRYGHMVVVCHRYFFHMFNGNMKVGQLNVRPFTGSKWCNCDAAFANFHCKHAHGKSGELLLAS